MLGLLDITTDISLAAFHCWNNWKKIDNLELEDHLLPTMERAYLKNIDSLLGFSFSNCELQVPAKIGIIDVTNTEKFLKYRPTLTGTKK